MFYVGEMEGRRKKKKTMVPNWEIDASSIVWRSDGGKRNKKGRILNFTHLKKCLRTISSETMEIFFNIILCKPIPIKDMNAKG